MLYYLPNLVTFWYITFRLHDVYHSLYYVTVRFFLGPFNVCSMCYYFNLSSQPPSRRRPNIFTYFQIVIGFSEWWREWCQVVNDEDEEQQQWYYDAGWCYIVEYPVHQWIRYGFLDRVGEDVIDLFILWEWTTMPRWFNPHDSITDRQNTQKQHGE